MNLQLHQPRWIRTIKNGESVLHLGEVVRRGGWYHLQNSEGDKIAIIKSFDETYDALVAYYMNHPRWYSDGAAQHFKFTPVGLLQVWQDQLENWVASRNLDDRLLRDGKRTTFPTVEEVKCAADAHLLDGWPDYKVKNDGLSWVDSSVSSHQSRLLVIR